MKALKSRNRTVCVLAIAFSASISLWGQETEPAKDEPHEGSALTRDEVSLYAGISAAVPLAGIILYAFPEIPSWALVGIQSLEHIPLYFVDPVKGVLFSGIEGAAIGTMYLPRILSADLPFFSAKGWNSFNEAAYFSTYELYKELRGRAGEGEYPGEWRRHDFIELCLSPMNPKNLISPFNILPVVFQASFFFQSWHCPVWESGKMELYGWVADASIGVPLMVLNNAADALLVAVGEEALFRGVLYEELKIRLGPIWAKVVDCTLFPAFHIPGEIRSGGNPGAIALLFLIRAAITLNLDFAYDEGGLPLSITVHALTDFLTWTIGDLLNSCEVPAQNASSVSPPLSVRFSIPL